MGDPVSVEFLTPAPEGLKADVLLTTSKGKRGTSMMVISDDIAPIIQFRGRVTKDKKPFNRNVANKYGAMTLAMVFHDYLKDNGIKIKGTYADIDRHGLVRNGRFISGATAEQQDRLTVLGSTWSPTLERIARETNHRSDNLYAESLFRRIGRLSGRDSYANARVQEYKILGSLGLDYKNRVRINDGSGLSNANQISPEFYTDFLAAMRKSPSFDSWLASLPHPGSNGTMKPLMTTRSEEFRSRIRLKSGAISCVRCYSGYILPAKPDGQWIYFSIMINNSAASRSHLTDTISGLIETITDEFSPEAI